MARPADPDKKSDIARRAVDVLEREGLGISAARLADEIGVKRPTLLYHFPTYGHLVEAALQDLLIEQTGFVLERVEMHAHPIDRLFAQVQAVHAFHQGRERRVVFLTQAIAATAGTRASAIMAAGNQIFEAHRRAAAERIRQGIADGTVAPCDADALVALVRSVIDGLMVQRVVAGLDFAPVHAFLWERVLAPLKLSAKPARAARRPSETSGARAAHAKTPPPRRSPRPSSRART